MGPLGPHKWVYGGGPLGPQGPLGPLFLRNTIFPENLHFCDLGEGWKLTENGTTALDGDLPINMSGGVLSSNPIGASGMIRFGEAALQVMHQANEYQVDGAKLAMGHAYGGASQFFAMWVVGNER